MSDARWSVRLCRCCMRKWCPLGHKRECCFPSRVFNRVLSSTRQCTALHGIALIQMADGNSIWFTRSFGPTTPPPVSIDCPRYVGWWCRGNEFSVVSADEGRYTRRALGFCDAPTRSGFRIVIAASGQIDFTIGGQKLHSGTAAGSCVAYRPARDGSKCVRLMQVGASEKFASEDLSDLLPRAAGMTNAMTVSAA